MKLYIADYMFKHGSPENKAKATQMIRTSDDAIASELYGRYPDSINATARYYGLANTHGASHWGNSTTPLARCRNPRGLPGLPEFDEWSPSLPASPGLPSIGEFLPLG